MRSLPRPPSLQVLAAAALAWAGAAWGPAWGLAGRAHGEEAGQEAPRGPRIRSIRFEGLRHAAEAALLEAAGFRPGDPWPEGSEVEIVRRLARWPYLASVRPPRVSAAPGGAVDVVVPVTEHVLTGEVRFEGNEALRAQALLDACGLRRGEPLLEGAVDEAAEAALDLYHKDGFLLASVEPESAPGPGGRGDVTFRISEGRRAYVTGVRLEGAREVPEGEVLSQLQLQPRRLFGLIARGYYVPSAIEADLDHLRAYYRSIGYLAVEAGLAAVDIDEARRSVRVTLRVREGPRHRVDGVRIEGHGLFPTRLLERQAGVATGVPFSFEAVADGLRRLVRWYEEHADIAPKIEARLEYGEPGSVTIVYEVLEEEHYLVGQVRVEGNRRTRDRVVRRDLRLAPGEHFTRLGVERSVAALEKRGLYEGVTITDSAGEGPRARDVTVAVAEKERWGLFEAGGGASTGAGEVGYFSLHHSNFDLFRLPRRWDDWRGAFTGGGQQLEIQLVPGTRESEYRLRFVEPYLFRSDLALTLMGGPSIYERRTYEEARLQGLAGLRKSFDEDHRFSLGAAWVADEVRLRGLETEAPADALDFEGRTLLSYPQLELRYDDHDVSFFSGPEGVLASVHVDLPDDAVGSEVDFTRAVLSADGSLRLFDRRPDYQHTLHVGLHAVWMDGPGDVPLFERLYLGGPHTFPGFEYRRVGPRDGKTPVGGEAGLYGLVEYSLPFFFREVRAVGLFAWGDLEPSIRDIAIDRFRTAAGGGLQVRLKVGPQGLPVNLYWMQALSSEEGDEEQVFSFSLRIGF